MSRCKHGINVDDLCHECNSERLADASFTSMKQRKDAIEATNRRHRQMKTTHSITINGVKYVQADQVDVRSDDAEVRQVVTVNGVQYVSCDTSILEVIKIVDNEGRTYFTQAIEDLQSYLQNTKGSTFTVMIVEMPEKEYESLGATCESCEAFKQ